MYDTYPSHNGVDLDIDSDMIEKGDEDQVIDVSEDDEDIDILSQNEVEQDIDNDLEELTESKVDIRDLDVYLQSDDNLNDAFEHEIVPILDSEDDIDNLEEFEVNETTIITNEKGESLRLGQEDENSKIPNQQEEKEGESEEISESEDDETTYDNVKVEVYEVDSSDENEANDESDNYEKEASNESEQVYSEEDDKEENEEDNGNKVWESVATNVALVPEENNEIPETKATDIVEQKVEFQYPIIVNISDENEYLLVPFLGETTIELEEFEPLFEITSVLLLTIEDFFGSLRDNQDLVDLHDIKLSDEMVLNVSELGGLSITEDNIYTKEITVDDLLKAFTSLMSNSSQNDGLPQKLTFAISTQTRFITKFNHLSECINLGKSFADIQNYSTALLEPVKHTEIIESSKRSHEDSLTSEDSKRQKLNST